MKKLLVSFFVVCCVTNLMSVSAESIEEGIETQLVCSEESKDLIRLESINKAIHLEERLKFFEDKIEELEKNFEANVEGDQAFKEGFAVGLGGAISTLCFGDLRIGPIFITTVLLGLNHVKCRTESHITSQLIGSLLGAQFLLFFVAG